jgi:trans-2-enoyl-CoA reductase
MPQMIKSQIMKYTTPALLYRTYGRPEEVVVYEDLKIKEVLDAEEIAIEMLAAPINPSDINQIEGRYAILPPLSAVGGNEGVGRIVNVGNGVTHLAVDDHVIPIRACQGTWRKQLICHSSGWIKIPKSIRVEHASMLAINPCTAYRMLKDFVELKPEDVIVQNGANSAVGQAVIQIARVMGLHTINIVRDRENLAYMKTRLQHLGATIVCTENELHSNAQLKACFKLCWRKKRGCFSTVVGFRFFHSYLWGYVKRTAFCVDCITHISRYIVSWILDE